MLSCVLLAKANGRITLQQLVSKKTKAANPYQEKLHLAAQYLHSKQFEDAAKLFKPLAKKLPKSPQVNLLLGSAYLGNGEVEKAVDAFRKAVRFAPEDPAPHLKLATALVKKNAELQSILTVLDKALKLDPGSVDANALKASVLIKHAQLDAADALIDQEMAKLTPDLKCLAQCAKAFQQVGNSERAEQIADYLLEAAPNDIDYIVLKADILFATEQHLECFSILSKAASERPQNTAIAFCFANLLLHLSRNYEALPYLELCTRKKPSDAKGRELHVHCLLMLERYDQADLLIRDWIKHHQHFTPTSERKRTIGQFQWLRAFIEFGRGNIEQAWEHYGARFDTGAVNGAVFLNYPAPSWTGEDLKGKTLLVWSDQGLGDTLKGASLIPELAQSAEKIILETEPRFVPFFSNSFPQIEVRPFTGTTGTQAARKSKKQTDFDLAFCLSDTPRFLRPDLKSFEKVRETVYTTDIERARNILSDVPGHDEKPIIGLCWRSQNMKASRARYYMNADDMIEIINKEDAIYINLQYKVTDEEIEKIASKCKGRFFHFKDADLFNDLDTLACLINLCDVVISANTNVADLAGVLDVPCVRFGGVTPQLTMGQDFVPWSRSVTFIPVREPANSRDMIPNVIDETKRKLSKWYPLARNIRLQASHPIAGEH